MNHFVVQLDFRKQPPPPEAMREQRSYLTQLLREGVLVMAGRFPDARGGGMAILRAPSLEIAQERYSTSPLVTRGLVDWQVREWTVTVGAGAPA